MHPAAPPASPDRWTARATRRALRSWRPPSACGSARTVILLAFVASLLQFACTHHTLGRPVFIGASATAGVGAATGSVTGDPLPVDLAVAYDAVVVAPHDDATRLADGLFYQRPSEAALEQIEAAVTRRPTIVFAIDWLFWPAYAPLPASPPATAPAAPLAPGDLRLDRVRTALALLERFDAAQIPLVIGNVPNLDDAADSATLPTEPANAAAADDGSAGGTLQASTQRPTASDLASINANIAQWAAARPWVAVLPLDEFMAQHAVTPSGAPLLQDDGLHPTAEGLVFLVQQAMDQLVARGLVSSRDWRKDLAGSDPALAMALETAARTSLDAPSAGWLDKAAAVLAYRELGDALEATPADCPKAVKAAQRLFEIAPRLESDPTGMGLGTMLAADAARVAMAKCPQTATSVRRCVERLSFDIRRPRPNPFRLSLWTELALLLGANQEVVDRALALSREVSAAPGGGASSSDHPTLDDYDDTLDRVEHLLREAPLGAPRGSGGGQPSNRTAIVALRGGPPAHLARGLAMLEALGDPAPHLERLGAGTVAAGQPPSISFPPSRDDARWDRSLQRAVVPVQALIDDLEAAAAEGDADSAAAGQLLAAALDGRLGLTGRGAAIGRQPSAVNRTSSDGPSACWAISTWGEFDVEARDLWLHGADATDEERGRSAEAAEVRRLIGGLSTLDLLLAAAPTHVVGQVGDFDAATGVLTIVDGQALVTTSPETATPDEQQLVSRPAAPADLRRQSIRAGAASWSSTSLGGCADLTTLEQALWRSAAAAGLDLAQPIPVRVDGHVEALELRVDRAKALAPPPGDTDRGAALHAALEPARFEIGPRSATLVGFISPWAIGTIVRPGRATRLHAVWTDASGQRHTAEVVGLRGGTDLSLKLPAPTMAP